MDTELLDQLDRLETAVDNVVDFITSYKPEVSAVEALVRADDNLSQGLRRLEEHQGAFHHVRSLRITAQALDERIKWSLTVLAETRHELMSSTFVGLADGTADSVAYEEAMDYARRIAKFAVPPDTATKSVPDSLDAAMPTQAVNGNGPGPSASSPFQKPEHNSLRGVVDLNHEQMAWLDNQSHPSNRTFVPWPVEDTIRSGALARIRQALEKGQDIATLDLHETANLRENASGIDGSDVADMVAKHEQADENGVKQSSGNSVPAAKIEKKRPRGLAGFNLYDPDAEDK